MGPGPPHCDVDHRLGRDLADRRGRRAFRWDAPQSIGRSTPAKKQYSAAQALAARGSYEEAVAAYETAIAADDKDATPYLQIARILRDDLGRLEESASWFRRVRTHAHVESGVAFLALRELTELFTHKLNQPRRALPLLAQVAETGVDTREGEWAARELIELRTRVFGDSEE